MRQVRKTTPKGETKRQARRSAQWCQHKSLMSSRGEVELASAVESAQEGTTLAFWLLSCEAGEG